MKCSRDCLCENCERLGNDIILAAVRLLRVIDSFGTRLDESDAINKLRIAAHAAGYDSDDRRVDAANR